ncbi:type II secretion system protein [Prosthecobacter vanneervenii]|uniref:Tfp pilus assembly protein FimT n=1 Tax=Prosthecobacter vanneervenii TaxID=48466 RepID=A0A7W7YAP5_9BACT|nr:hypothetical protein [Prosthecobacter vanneervenii]MBB5032723.1 Tfp pilus assembly protein FimT [Prosthecobacter vanneervenii]
MNTQQVRCSRAFSNPEYLVALTILAILASVAMTLISRCHRQSQLRESPVRVHDAEKKQH